MRQSALAAGEGEDPGPNHQANASMPLRFRNLGGLFGRFAIAVRPDTCCIAGRGKLRRIFVPGLILHADQFSAGPPSPI